MQHLCMGNLFKMVRVLQKLILKWKFFMRKSQSKSWRKVMVRNHPNTQHVSVSIIGSCSTVLMTCLLWVLMFFYLLSSFIFASIAWETRNSPKPCLMHSYYYKIQATPYLIWLECPFMMSGVSYLALNVLWSGSFTISPI